MHIKSSSAIPNNYEAWKHCITVDCNIKLTAPFIKERIEALGDTKNAHTQAFVKLYGEQYRQIVLHWFVKALQEITT